MLRFLDLNAVIPDDIPYRLLVVQTMDRVRNGPVYAAYQAGHIGGEAAIAAFKAAAFDDIAAYTATPETSVLYETLFKAYGDALKIIVKDEEDLIDLIGDGLGMDTAMIQEERFRETKTLLKRVLLRGFGEESKWT